MDRAQDRAVSLLGQRRNVDSRMWHLLTNVVAASYLLHMPQRIRLLSQLGLEIETEWVLPGCYFFSSDVSIGANTWINHRCYFDSRAPIRIGNGCDVAMEVMFCTSSHEPGPPTKRAGAAYNDPIVVEDGCWLGTRSVVLPGVTIGEGCVIGSGAVVRADCEPHGFYAGVPARRIRDLPAP